MANIIKPVFTSEQKNSLLTMCFERDSYDALEQGADGDWVVFERIRAKGSATTVLFIGVIPGVEANFQFSCSILEGFSWKHGPILTVDSLIGTELDAAEQRPEAVRAIFCAVFNRLFQLEPEARAISVAGVPQRHSTLLRRFVTSTLDYFEWRQNGDVFVCDSPVSAY